MQCFQRVSCNAFIVEFLGVSFLSMNPMPKDNLQLTTLTAELQKMAQENRIRVMKEYYKPNVLGIAHNQTNGMMSLEQLLILPNRFPKSAVARRACEEFDQCITLWDHSLKWGDARDICIKHIYQVYNKFPHRDVASNRTLAGKTGGKIKKSLTTAFKNIVATCIMKFAYGFHTRRSDLTSLSRMAGTTDHNGVRLLDYCEVHACFVLPMIHFVLEAMNIHNNLSYRAIMEVNVGSFEVDIIAKVSKGIWSSDFCLKKIRKQQLCHTHAKMCTGVYYEHARLLCLIVQGFQFPAKEMEFLTDDEKRSLGEDLMEGDVIDRYPEEICI